MRPSKTFTITPTIPAELERLFELAANLRWAWDHETIDLFRRLDPDLWETSGHNPVSMLGTLAQERLEAAASDDSILAYYHRVCEALDQYLANQTAWYRKTHQREGLRIGYLSAEYGLTECLPIYSGGMGVLAGDHLKASSDLGIPLIGVGLLYQRGYFHQYLNVDGWQQEAYVHSDFYTMPLALERRPDGSPVTITVAYPGRDVEAQVWRAQVGRVPLYLLDANIAANRPEDRRITEQLYGGDQEMRLMQEIMLGIGGVRALDALGRRPTVCHMNEGHAAFAVLERIRLIMAEHGVAFHEAAEAASASSVFTTHTPVPAGHDYFPPELMDRYFEEYYPQLGLTRDEFLGLGRQHLDEQRELFSMTVLALRLSAHRNAVSQLHGKVTRRMWQSLWPGVPQNEVPIAAKTNGVHLRSWISHDLDQLFDRYVGPHWRDSPADEAIWRRLETIPAEELWRTHERRRERLVAFARRRIQTQLRRRGAPPAEMAEASDVLDPEVLTIGFGRRFTDYKRAALLLRDPDRLAAILNHPERPVQIIYAGKAHPRDDPGKELIRRIIHLCRQDRFARRIVFLEDYDMAVARYMVQGSDVWLNTPRRTHEASGTSGMKAAANGVLNLSILDGWWDEAYTPAVGWAIGHGEIYDNEEMQDAIESRVLYDLLEKEVVPLFYQRGRDGLPRGWIERVKTSMHALCPVFNTSRLVREYVERCYLPSFARGQRLSEDGMARARVLAAWKRRVRQHWHEVRVESVDSPDGTTLRVGSLLKVQARVILGSLSPDDVSVQLYFGGLDATGAITDGTVIPMAANGARQDKALIFETEMPARTSGRHGLTVRVLPRHPDLATPVEMGLVVWA